MSDPPPSRGSRAFASRGGEQRVRTAVGLARRLADVGLRYRRRELQLLVIPCLLAWLPVVFPPTVSSPVHPLVAALALCFLWLSANVALSFALPWLDQHFLPVAAMTASTHYALALLPTVQIEWFPMTGGLIALYTAFGVRLASLAIPRRRRPARRHFAGRAAFWLGSALLVLAAALLTVALLSAALLTAAIARSVPGPV
ncbi:MAG TPA: hypothetical protein VFN74_21515 [Chloroflexota bacterium]|nr:hypothetical protein [Chloroflexota bacterium]